MRLDLLFTMRDIDINSKLNPITKFTSSSRSSKLKDVLPWSISKMITKTIPINKRIVISYAIQMRNPFWVWRKVYENETTTWSGFPNGRKGIVEQILASEKINKSKRVGLWESTVRDTSRKVNFWIRSDKI